MMHWLLILLLLACSALFSSLETALFSLSAYDRHRLKQSGGISTLVLKTIEHPREVLSTILFGNELVNVAISVLVASMVYGLFYSGGAESRGAYLASVGGTTLLLLVFGEITPKNIAVRNPIFLAQVLIIPYQAFYWLITPLRFVLSHLTDFIVGLFGVEAQKQRRLIVEEEIETLLEMGNRQGTLGALETDLIRGTFDFSQIRVAQVMTPREKVIAIAINTPMDEIFSRFEATVFSRFPVYEGDLDHVVGIFLAKNLLPYRLGEQTMPVNWADLLVPFSIVQSDQTLDDAFFMLQSQQVHMALVKTRERVVGLVTMDDLLNKFLGESKR